MRTQLRSVAGLALGSMFLVFLACDHSSPTEPDGAVGFQTVLKATIPGPPPDFQGREAVRDQATWQAVWTELQGDNPQPQPLPAVDFNREMVVLVVGPGCCGNAEILSIAHGRSELVVGAQTQSGTALCVREDFSVHAVRLSRIEVPVRLDLRSGTKSC